MNTTTKYVLQLDENNDPNDRAWFDRRDHYRTADEALDDAAALAAQTGRTYRVIKRVDQVISR